MKKYADKTLNPELWRGTYWGNFGVTDDEPEPETVSNRDRFGEEFGISEEVDLPVEFRMSPRSDHPELFRTTGGDLVLVVSNYPHVEGPPDEGHLGDAEWTEIPTVYGCGSRSWVSRFGDMAELRRLLRGGAAV